MPINSSRIHSNKTKTFKMSLKKILYSNTVNCYLSKYMGTLKIHNKNCYIYKCVSYYNTYSMLSFNFGE